MPSMRRPTSSSGPSSPERVGVITCGYDEGQTFEPDPVSQYLFSWRRRAVDIAVCNSQGEFALDWWPMYPDARAGDIVIFGLAPHERLSLSTHAEEGREVLRSRLEDLGGGRDLEYAFNGQNYMPYESIAIEASGYCNATSLREPLHPDFCDDPTSPIACPGPAFQGLGVVTDQISELDRDTEDGLTEVEVGHIILFPCSLKTELAGSIGDHSSELHNFWKPDLPMEVRAADQRPYEFEDSSGNVVLGSSGPGWLTPYLSTKLLDELSNLSCFAEQQVAEPTLSQFPQALGKLRRIAGLYRSGKRPNGPVFPQVFQLGTQL